MTSRDRDGEALLLAEIAAVAALFVSTMFVVAPARSRRLSPQCGMAKVDSSRMVSVLFPAEVARWKQ